MESLVEKEISKSCEKSIIHIQILRKRCEIDNKNTTSIQKKKIQENSYAGFSREKGSQKNMESMVKEEILKSSESN